MKRKNNQKILVVNDIEATRESTEILLERDGYSIETAVGEQDATRAAREHDFDLLLVSLEGETAEVVESVKHIRENAAINENVPVIIFCADESKENETAVEPNIFLSCPENFNHLRSFISRLLQRQSQKAS